MRYKYAFADKEDEKTAKAVGISLDISIKHSVEVCNYIRGKNAEKAVALLESVRSLKKPIPYKRFHRDLSHKTEIGPGRYPVNTCAAIQKVLESAMANAENQGLSREDLFIKHICAHRAARPWRYGRHARRKAKRSHIEVVLEEIESDKHKKKSRKAGQKAPEKQIKPEQESGKPAAVEPIGKEPKVKTESKQSHKSEEAGKLKPKVDAKVKVADINRKTTKNKVNADEVKKK